MWHQFCEHFPWFVFLCQSYHLCGCSFMQCLWASLRDVIDINWNLNFVGVLPQWQRLLKSCSHLFRQSVIIWYNLLMCYFGPNGPSQKGMCKDGVDLMQTDADGITEEEVNRSCGYQRAMFIGLTRSLRLVSSLRTSTKLRAIVCLSRPFPRFLDVIFHNIMHDLAIMTFDLQMHY